VKFSRSTVLQEKSTGWEWLSCYVIALSLQTSIAICDHLQ